MCETCQNTGLLPFIKNGKVIPNAFLFCPDCYDPYKNVYPYALKPSDFDYSMSYSVYRSLCQSHKWRDPGSDGPPEHAEPQPQVIEHIHRTSDMGRKEFDLLQQTARRLSFLEKKLTERGKPKAQAKKQSSDSEGELEDITDRYLR